MKSLAHLHVWWPGSDKEIETIVHNCVACQSVRNKQPPTNLHPWSWATRLWHRVHLDFAGPFLGSMFLIAVDAHSKWIEAIMMTSTTTSKTITELRKMFAAYGLPEQVISDNGPQFTSNEFDEFMKKNGIKHILTSPYHPKSNGEAERAVQTFKNSLKAREMEKEELQTKLSRFLLCYRTTPTTSTGLTPSELFMKRRLRTRLDLLKPSVEERMSNYQEVTKQYADRKAKARNFEIGEPVFVENVKGQPKWVPATVTEKIGSVMYRVQVNNESWRRHADQIRMREVVTTEQTDEAADYSSDEEIQEIQSEQVVEYDLSAVDNPSSVSMPTEESQSRTPVAQDQSASELVQVPIEPRYPRRTHVPPDRWIEKC